MGKIARTAECVTLLNIGVNILLTVCKLVVGFRSGAQSLVSDGVHSLADVVSSLVVLAGIRLAYRRSDRAHPYGYERMECVAAILLAMLVGITGGGIGLSGITALMDGVGTASPGRLAMIVAMASVAVKEIMFRYTRYAAKRSDSAALLADAWHLRADALSSLGSVIGVWGANAGVRWLDPLCAAFIGVFIVKAAVQIFIDAVRKMTDHACDEDLQERLRAFVREQTGVKEVVQLKTRLFGNRVLAEVTVAVEETLSASEAYRIALSIRETVPAAFEVVKECSVHILPDRTQGEE